MPDFADPFKGVIPERRLTKGELIRAIRLNIAAEEEAAFIYEAHAEATDNVLAKKVLLDVADEERVHIGEFQRLLSILAADEDDKLAQGKQEVDEMIAALGQGGQAPSNGSAGFSGEEPTVGSLRE